MNTAGARILNGLGGQGKLWRLGGLSGLGVGWWSGGLDEIDRHAGLDEDLVMGSSSSSPSSEWSLQQ